MVSLSTPKEIKNKVSLVVATVSLSNKCWADANYEKQGAEMPVASSCRVFGLQIRLLK